MKRYKLIDNKTSNITEYNSFMWTFAWAFVFAMGIGIGFLIGLSS